MGLTQPTSVHIADIVHEQYTSALRLLRVCIGIPSPFHHSDDNKHMIILIVDVLKQHISFDAPAEMIKDGLFCTAKLILLRDELIFEDNFPGKIIDVTKAIMRSNNDMSCISSIDFFHKILNGHVNKVNLDLTVQQKFKTGWRNIFNEHLLSIMQSILTNEQQKNNVSIAVNEFIEDLKKFLN